MDEKKILAELETIRNELQELPMGYISEKNIAGKKRHYLQWNENGKKKSKYVNDAYLAEMKTKIERRRLLCAEERKLLKLLPKEKKPMRKFHMNVLLKDELKKYAYGVKDYKKRSIYRDIDEFIHDNKSEKILILYGLRRTGKTTLMRQLIYAMDEKHLNQTAFIQILRGKGLSELNEDLRLLLNLDYKYIFIDEATAMDDFIEGAALLSDIYAASGMKIILSGTDSLGFYLSKSEALYDRCLFLHTTFIPYKEFENVLGIKGIDEFIAYGGTMSLSGLNYNSDSPFANKEKADEYLDSAIAHNIQHSLAHYQYGGHFRSLYELYEKDELTSAINRVVEDLNHRFTLEVIDRDFSSHDFGMAAKNLRSDRNKPTSILDRIDKEAFTKRLKELLEIKNKEERKVDISPSNCVEIKEYLDALDITVDVEIRHLPAGGSNLITVFTQPGLCYSQARFLIQSLLLDETFSSLSATEMDFITELIISDVKGRMMEDIVILETKKAYPDKDVFKLQFAVGEFDMVVLDKERKSVEIYEIKHSEERVKDQYRHLVDERKLESTAFRFGDIVKRAVIYRGNDYLETNGIEYKNVEEYLKELP